MKSTPLPGLSGTSFAVLKGPGGFVPTQIELKDDKVISTTGLADPMPYEAVAYQYLMEAVRRHYAGLWKLSHG